MNTKLFISAITKFLIGFILVVLLIFIPAGTIYYPHGWLLITILFVPMFFAGIVMMIKSPELLKKRLDAKEKQSEQSVILKLSGLMFLSGFIIAGLGYRLNWYMLPNYIAVIFVVSYILYAEVLRENAYLSRTIEVQENQKIIDTGLYGIVRHPMYFATVLLFLSIPLVLGSLYSFFNFSCIPFYNCKTHKI